MQKCQDEGESAVIHNECVGEHTILAVGHTFIQAS